MLGAVDLATVERGACAVLLRFPEHVKRIVRCPGRSAQYADDQLWIVRGQRLHRRWPGVRDLQEHGSSAARDARQRPSDAVINEAGNVLGAHFAAGVRSKYFQEVPEPFLFGLQAKRLVFAQRLVIQLDVIIQGDRIETQIRAPPAFVWLALALAAHRVIDGGRAERHRWLLGVAARSGGQPDVGGIVGSDGRRDRTVVEQPFLQRQDLVRTGAHQRDVDQALLHHVANQLPVLGERTETGLARMMLRAQAGRRQTERHVSVLGVGHNKVAAAGIGQNAGQFAVECLFHGLCGRSPVGSQR